MNKEKLTELVYINLGRASMCWSDIPSGVFDSTKAAELGKEIMEAIEKYVEEYKESGWNNPLVDYLDWEERYNKSLKELARQKEERKFKLDDPFKEALEEAVVSDTEDTAEEWLLPRAFKKESGEYIPNGYNVYIKEKEIEKISEDEARIREILNDPSSMFVGYSQEGYNLHIWINQGKKYYIEPELNRINRIEY